MKTQDASSANVDYRLDEKIVQPSTAATFGSSFDGSSWPSGELPLEDLRTSYPGKPDEELIEIGKNLDAYFAAVLRIYLRLKSEGKRIKGVL